MSIAFRCPACDKKLKSRDELAGKRVKWPSCGEVILLPADAPEPPPKAADEPLVEAEERIQYDGLYKRAIAEPFMSPSTTWPPRKPMTGYLRFYADGTVLVVASERTPEQVSRWFSKKYAGVTRGTYTVAGNVLTFTVRTNPAGMGVVAPPATIEYKGVVNGQRLELDCRGSNDRWRHETYTFVPVTVTSD